MDKQIGPRTRVAENGAIPLERMLARAAIQVFLSPHLSVAADITSLRTIASNQELRVAWAEVRNVIDSILIPYQRYEATDQETAARILVADERYARSERLEARVWRAFTQGRIGMIRAAHTGSPPSCPPVMRRHGALIQNPRIVRDTGRRWARGDSRVPG